MGACWFFCFPLTLFFPGGGVSATESERRDLEFDVRWLLLSVLPPVVEGLCVDRVLLVGLDDEEGLERLLRTMPYAERGDRQYSNESLTCYSAGRRPSKHIVRVAYQIMAKLDIYPGYKSSFSSERSFAVSKPRKRLYTRTWFLPVKVRPPHDSSTAHNK